MNIRKSFHLAFTKRILASLGILAFCLCFLDGCNFPEGSSDKIRDLEFTVVSEENLSDELKTILDERKANPFKVTFNDKEYLYICIGYGQQATGGYSIAVDSLYLTEDAILVSTSLLGPGPDDDTSSSASYPYIVLKTEYLDIPVIFE